MRTFFVLQFLIEAFAFSQCAKILASFHVPSYSHNAVPNAIIEELARRGHEITVLTSQPRKTPVKNIREIMLPDYEKVFEDEKKDNLFATDGMNAVLVEMFLNSMMLQATEELLKHKNVQQLLQSEEKFDLVMIEDFVGHALKGFAHHFNAHCIMVNSLGMNRLAADQVANPFSPSYLSDFPLPYAVPRNFFQRLHTTLMYFASELFQHLYVIPKHNQLLQKYFPRPPSHINDIYYNVSLAFVNGHVSVQRPVPYVPNVIDIGGVHVKPPKQLPKDIQEFLDDAKDGVVFFSMGSNLKSADISKEKLEAVLKTFAKLKQRVLWKFEDENFSDKPSNVKIGKWLPQSDILAHPNVKVFITHGGLMSQIEAVNRGVPVLGIPVFGDQKMNLANAELKGTALILLYSEISEDSFTSKLNELLTNPKYRENAKKYAQIMNDQPIPPLEKAVFWTEYVLRHNGAPHLRTAALHLSWYQYLLLDVILFIIVVLTLIFSLFCIAVKKLMCRRTKTKPKSKRD